MGDGRYLRGGDIYAEMKADELILYEQYIRCQTRDDVLRRDVLIDFAPLIE